MNDTICAISTPLATGAISIIRMSGNESINIASKIFKGKDLRKVNDHTINYGHIYDDNILIDEVMVSVMLAPNTYTCEDVVEINAHGSVASAKRILELLLKEGCRLANPGEFTERAFMNGRIDLIEAESVMDLINSNTEQSLLISVNQLTGKTSNKIKEIRDMISDIETNIEVNIDFPEYDDVDILSNELIHPKLLLIKKELELILDNSRNSKYIKDGIDTVIIGKPNVGKSSILNKLIDEDKAIVTDIPGTTRDIVEGVLNLNGVKLNLIDTAGIRETTDLVESIGVQKSIDLIEKASLVILVLDNNSEITDKEYELLEKIKNKNYIIIINKTDLQKRIIDTNLDNVIYMSAVHNKGIEEFKNRIISMYELNKISKNDFYYVSSSRSISLIEKAIVCIDNSIDAIAKAMPIDIVEIDINKASEFLGDILGINYKEDLFSQLFSNFCLGK